MTLLRSWLRSYFRILRLGCALARLEAFERAGGAVCLHSSWCAAPGSGWWIVLLRPAGWSGAPLGRPTVGRDLAGVIEAAIGSASGPAAGVTAPRPARSPSA